MTMATKKRNTTEQISMRKDQIQLPRQKPPVEPEKTKSNRSQLNACAALKPAINSQLVVAAYQANIMGNDVDHQELANGLQASFKTVNDGDLTHLEDMLVGQATALQTMFVHLSQRAIRHEQLPHLEAFMNLALKAQSQCRATISTLVDLKNPRQATFVKQANIAHGPQQVNNGEGPTGSESRARKSGKPQNKLLAQEPQDGSTYLDNGAATTPARPDREMASLGKIDRTNKC